MLQLVLTSTIVFFCLHPGKRELVIGNSTRVVNTPSSQSSAENHHLF